MCIRDRQCYDRSVRLTVCLTFVAQKWCILGYGFYRTLIGNPTLKVGSGRNWPNRHDAVVPAPPHKHSLGGFNIDISPLNCHWREHVVSQHDIFQRGLCVYPVFATSLQCKILRQTCLCVCLSVHSVGYPSRAVRFSAVRFRALRFSASR